MHGFFVLSGFRWISDKTAEIAEAAEVRSLADIEPTFGADSLVTHTLRLSPRTHCTTLLAPLLPHIAEWPKLVFVLELHHLRAHWTLRAPESG